jgi:hypothetical protein
MLPGASYAAPLPADDMKAILNFMNEDNVVAILLCN